MIRATEQPHLIMEEVTDPEELARAKVRHEMFQRNLAWFDAHAKEIYAKYRGKCICIAGEELFAAETPEEVLVQAKATYPDDEGLFTRIIPRDKGDRIYAHQRTLV